MVLVFQELLGFLYAAVKKRKRSESDGSMVK